MNAADVQELLDELEENQNFVSGARVFNKPTLISISSADREPEDVNQTPYSQVAFSSFAVNLPRPALDVDSIQLVSSNLPMCNQSIPDTACAFWYYRLSLYSGIIPNPNNLFMNRLLPSYYKPELIDNSALFASNKTFTNYTALSTELAKASSTDLAYYNWINVVRPTLEGVKLDLTANTYIPFRPNDLLVSYNSTLNKFQGTGNADEPATAAYNSGTTYALGAIVATPLVYAAYNAGTTYAIGDIVIVNFVLYRSLQNANTGNQVNVVAFWKSIGDLCFWNRPQTFKSLQASNTNHTPASSPTFWQEIGVDYILPWDVTITYNKGRVVLYNGVLYISTAQVWNNVPDSLDRWAEVDTDFYRYLITGPRDPTVVPAQAGADPFVFNAFPKLEWNQYALYEVGDRVEYDGQLWRCVQQNQNAIPQQVNTIWQVGTGYAFGTIVRYRGVVFQALAVVPANFAPGPSNAYWEQITFWGWDNCEWVGTVTYNFNDPVLYGGLTFQLNALSSFNQPPPTLWSGSTSYLAEDIVVFANKRYECIQSNTNQQPDTFPTFWAYIDTPTEDVPAWSAENYYGPGEIVRYDAGSGDDQYACIELNINNEPDNSPTKWQPLTVAGWDVLDPDRFAAPSYGLYTTSATLDFVEQSDTEGEILLPFPTGIQAQPFTPVPKRLLNSITGFTFNGVFNASAFNALGETAAERVIPSQVTSLFNRTRPVPIYDVIAGTAPLSLKDQAATATRVYTADGYCNLVYSSIISTYCDIVGASSVDTQQTTNLLAVNTMNCGNLGISFYAPFIDNPLTKMQNDIFTIFVEFRDEFGDLYHFTNNAVVTLTFKVTYKK
jgi:hypothetical protein